MRVSHQRLVRGLSPTKTVLVRTANAQNKFNKNSPVRITTQKATASKATNALFRIQGHNVGTQTDKRG